MTDGTPHDLLVTPLAGDALEAPLARFCLACNEPLPPEGARCHHCGRAFDRARTETFAAAPRFLPWRFWLPGFLLAVASGVISYAIVMLSGAMGWALFIAVPLSFGAILGYASRTRVWWILVLLSAAIPGVAISILALSLAGFFCGGMLTIIFAGPASLGVVLGMGLRYALRHSGWDQRMFLPLAGLALFPYAAELAESWLPRERVVATIETSLTIDATAAEAWQALMTYEEVDHEPPLLLKLALPKPIRSEGKKSAVGDVVRCIYDRGRLCKQITEVIPQRRLSFIVTQQQLAFVDVKLLGGRFEFAPHGAGTKVTLTTEYEQVLRPEAVWRPAEQRVIHALHGHVLEGIRRKTIRNRDEQKPYQPPTQKTGRSDRITMEPEINNSFDDRPQFSLRTLFCLVTGLGIVFGILTGLGLPIVQVPLAFGACGLVVWLTIILMGVQRKTHWNTFVPVYRYHDMQTGSRTIENDPFDSIDRTGQL
jgi:hypothetical protein